MGKLMLVQHAVQRYLHFLAVFADVGVVFLVAYYLSLLNLNSLGLVIKKLLLGGSCRDYGGLRGIHRAGELACHVLFLKLIGVID